MNATTTAPLTPESRSVLVFAQERFVSRLVQVNLERAGFRVSIAATLEESCQRLEMQPPSAVIMQLPASNPRLAWDLLEITLTSPSAKRVRVVVLGYPERSESLLEARAAGADACLTIPFGPGALLRTLGDGGPQPPLPPQA